MLLKWEKVVIRSAILKYLFLKKNILIVSDCLKIDSDIYIGIFRTIAQWTGQVHWIILKPLKPIIALPQTKNNQILWKRSKAKFLNHTHLCSSCLDASNDLQAILLLGHFHPSGTWNDYCLLNWKPLPRLHIISLFLCVLKNLLVCKFWSKKS